RRCVFAPAGTFGRCGGRGEGQPRPPGAGPFFLPAHERGEGGECCGSGKGSIFKRLRSGRRRAQPSRYGAAGTTGPEQTMASGAVVDQFRAENHR
ncbi:hypothetical protein, partial [Mesorhizobium sp. M1393]|uniref:hypothetical protein n=1 Tax=Mesorhizobium sp. M1393 TaxID=2957094 RepID=UPI0033371AAA